MHTLPTESRASAAQLRLLSDSDLDREMAASDHDADTRMLILYERIRRNGRVGAGTHWTRWVTLALVLITCGFAAIAAWPVLENFGEKEFFDF